MPIRNIPGQFMACQTISIFEARAPWILSCSHSQHELTISFDFEWELRLF
jgi:hypothetical protein